MDEMVEVVGMILNGLKAYAAIAAAIFLAGLLAVQTVRLTKAHSALDKAAAALAIEQAGWANERANAAQALAQATTKARETEQQLTVRADTFKEETHAQITSLSARAADLSKRLRVEAANAATARLVSRATAAPGAGEAAGRADVPELSRPDGERIEFLISEAERADKIRIQLGYCERQYDAARAALNPASFSPTSLE